MQSPSIGARGLIGETAATIAARVRAGEADPVDVVQTHIESAGTRDRDIGAFRILRPERALEEAVALAARPDLADLPLAGVPVAIKDNVCVAGEAMRNGSAATPETPCVGDHEVVRRLRAAGAIVIGITNVPEFAVWATSDGPSAMSGIHGIRNEPPADPPAGAPPPSPRRWFRSRMATMRPARSAYPPPAAGSSD